MEGRENRQNVLIEASTSIMERTGPGSKTAMGIAMDRALESMKPEGERICYDPYAIHFINPDMLDWAVRNPDKAKAIREERERLVPGSQNSIIARVRYFDDFVKGSIDDGLGQLVILGAGYDTRAYRMVGLKKIRTFEVDHPVTQVVKKEKIKEIFGGLTDNVVYIPVDLGTEDLSQKLLDAGYDRSLKTLFLMEGLLYYLSPDVVDEILSFIVKNSGEGSSIIFDYFPRSIVNENSSLELGKHIRNGFAQIGEPLRFGIGDGMVEAFLKERGFSKICNVTGDDCKRAYFYGVNEGRAVSNLLNFVHAVIK